MAHRPVSVLPLARDLQPLLRTRWMGRPLEGHVRIDSTSTRAARWAAEGAPPGAVVVADEQTRGRGRYGRRWHSTPGRNLNFSAVLRPALAPDRYGCLVMAAAVAVCRAIEPVAAPLRPAIKWPNDVLLDGRKCCGLLLEAAHGAPARGTAARGTSARGRPAVVLGVGLNVNQQDFPDDLRAPATSLLLAAGRLVPRAPLLARLLHVLEDEYDALADDGAADLHRAYDARLAGRGQPLTLHFAGSDREVTGRLAGVMPTGALCLRTPGGLRTFAAGEVSTHPSAQ